MIESQSNASLQPPKPPSNEGTQIKSGSFQPPSNPSSNKRMIFIILGLLFFVAIVGGVVLFRNISNQGTDITSTDTTFAWRPSSVAGTCVGGRVIGNNESVPYDFEFTFILSSGGRSAVLSHTFKSKPVGNSNKIDENFSWSDFGTDGVDFASKLRTGDKINWRVVVKYTQNGQAKTEEHSDFFTINDTSCGASSTPAPSPTVAPSPSASATGTPRPTGTPVPTAVPTGVPTAPPTSAPTATPNGTAEPTGTPTPTPTPTNPPSNPTSTPVAQSTQPPQVADNSSETLPNAGISNGVWFLIVGGTSLVVSVFLAIRKKKYD
jgi:LPXTG-motif cell wall-anchored protein